MKIDKTSAPLSRRASLDTLRGAAILAVFFSHILSNISQTEIIDHALIVLGRGGVTLFFLLSGYLIFQNVQNQPTITFIVRRFFKIMPSYWVNIIVILIADLSVEVFSHFSIGSYLASFLAVSDLLGIEAVSGVFWTLLIEIKFYIFIAIEYAFLGRRYIRTILIALILLEVFAVAIRGRGSLTAAYFPVFYLGIEISIAEAEKWRPLALFRLVAVSALLAISLYVCLDQYKIGSSGSLIICAIFFIIFLRGNISIYLISFIGITSYSNYLYHSIVIGAVFMAFNSRPESMPITAATLAMAFLMTTIIAAVFYGFVEVPMVRLGRRLTARWVV